LSARLVITWTPPHSRTHRAEGELPRPAFVRCPVCHRLAIHRGELPVGTRLGLKCARCRLEFRVEVHPEGATP
jgi:hypothetical protein